MLKVMRMRGVSHVQGDRRGCRGVSYVQGDVRGAMFNVMAGGEGRHYVQGDVRGVSHVQLGDVRGVKAETQLVKRVKFEVLEQASVSLLSAKASQSLKLIKFNE